MHQLISLWLAGPKSDLEVQGLPNGTLRSSESHHNLTVGSDFQRYGICHWCCVCCRGFDQLRLRVLVISDPCLDFGRQSSGSCKCADAWCPLQGWLMPNRHCLMYPFQPRKRSDDLVGQSYFLCSHKLKTNSYSDPCVFFRSVRIKHWRFYW